MLLPFVRAMPKVMKKHIKQLSAPERRVIDNVIRKKGTPMDALRKINKARRLTSMQELDHGAVYRFTKGVTHKRDAEEARGRKPSLSTADVRKLDLARRRLIKHAKNAKRVTWADVIKEAALENPPCQRVCVDALRKLGVRFRHPRRKIFVTEKDAAKRRETADVWVKRPAKYWTQVTYLDEKKFLRPTNPAQRQRLLEGRVTGHLRKPSEGISRGFTKPREKHTFVGMPSVNVCAAVAQDRIILWHVVAGSWNGAAAAEMYEKHLKPALVRKWGERKQYLLVEDGDRKGHMSGKGIAAKGRAKIKSVTLPPRTPSLMPLDYAIWQRIEQKLIDTAPSGNESKAAFLARLRIVGTTLPKTFIKKAIGRMRGNLKALSDAKGFAPRKD